MTDRNIRDFFVEFTEPVSPLLRGSYIVQEYETSGGTSKQARVAGVLKFALKNGGEKYLDSIVVKAIKRFGMTQLKSDEDGKKLLGELTKEGFSWELLSEEDEIVEGLEIPAKVSFIKSELRQRGYEITLHHLEEALSSLSTGNYSAANSQIRTFFESFYIDVMHDVIKSSCSGGGCRKEFADKYCSPEENEALKSYAELLHTNGSHPGQAEKYEAEFRLISAVAWVLYAMEIIKVVRCV